jgi:hypothetical protein
MASVGKSTFLDYILGWEATMGNRILYWAQEMLYVFDCLNISYMDTTSTQPTIFGATYHDLICLIDSMESIGKHTLPLFLMCDKDLFIIQAASPNLAHKEWAKKQPLVCKFVLNPPKEDEIIGVSGLFSLFFDSD